MLLPLFAVATWKDLLMQTLTLPYAMAVSVSFFFAVMLMRRVGLMFPPIPALAVIPFILPDTYLYFPIEVAFGGAYAVIIPLFKSYCKRIKLFHYELVEERK